ncbi:MAG: hypothetical protein ACP6IP_00155 [Candidatus Njordarchaeia archaeon]
MICTKKWNKPLPSVTGQGAQDIKEIVKLDYWKKLDERIKETFDLAKRSTDIIVNFIIGEWGLGKTSLFEAHLLPTSREKNAFPIKLTANDIFDLYKKTPSHIYRRVDKLIFSIFANILSSMGRNVLASNLKEITALDLVDKVYEKIDMERKNLLVIFIDEFEDILKLDNSTSSEIISALTSLINGEFEPFSKNGKYRGRLLIFIAMTDYVASRFFSESLIEKEDETAGKHIRRFKRINLRRLSRNEMIKFIEGILRYIYNNNVPETRPINSIIIYEIIYKVSNGNPGIALDILNKLLNRLATLGSAENEDCVKVAEIDDLLEILDKSSQISSKYNIDLDRIEFLIDRLKETNYIPDTCEKNIENAIKILLLSPSPLSYNDLKSININIDENEFANLINELNTFFLKFYNSQILKFNNINNQETFHKILNQHFEKNIDVQNQITKMLTKYIFLDGKIKSLYLVPGNEYALDIVKEEIFRELNIDRLKVGRFLTDLKLNSALDQQDYYRVPTAVLNEIYPPQCPICSLYEDRTVALEIWEDSFKQVRDAEANGEDLGKAALAILLNYETWRDEKYKENVGQLGEIYIENVPIVGKSYKIKYKAYGILNSIHLDSKPFKSFLEKNKHSSLIILFVKDNIKKSVEKKLSYKDKMQNFKIVPLTTKQMATLFSIYKLIKQARENSTLDQIMHDKIEKMIIEMRRTNSINQQEFWNKTAQELLEKGFILARPDWDGEIRDIPKIMDYAIVTVENLFDIKKTWETFKEISKFMIFGKKRYSIFGGSKDIESEKTLKNFFDKLASLNFLKKIQEYYQISESPIEKRVLRLLSYYTKNGNGLNAYNIVDFFSIEQEDLSSIMDMIQDVYLKLLENKGLIKRYTKAKGKNEMYILADLKELHNEFFKGLNSLEKQLQSKRENWKKIALLFTTKERKVRIINIFDFYNSIKNMYLSEVQGADESIKRRAYKTGLRLLKILTDEITNVDNVYKNFEVELSRVNNLINDMNKTLKDLEDYINDLFNIDIDFKDYRDYKEFIDLKELKDEILNLSSLSIEVDYNEKKIESIQNMLYKLGIFRIVKRLEIDERKFVQIFKKERYENIEHFYNVKYYLIMELKEKLGNIHKKINEIKKEFEEFKKYMSKLKENKEKLERTIAKIQKSITQLDTKTVALKVKVDIESIENIPKQNIKNIQSLLDYISRQESYARNIVKILENLINTLNELSKVNIDECKKLRDKVRSEIENNNIEYEDLNMPRINFESEMKKFDEALNIIHELLNKNTLIINKQTGNYIEKLQNAIKKLKWIYEIHENIENIVSRKQKQLDSEVKTLDSIIQTLQNHKDKMDETEKEQLDEVKQEIDKIYNDYLEGRNITKGLKKLDELKPILDKLKEKYENKIYVKLIEIINGSSTENIALSTIIKRIKNELENESIDESELTKNILTEIQKLEKSGRIKVFIKKL